MQYSTWIRTRVVPLELLLAGRCAFLRRLPLLRRLNRRVTARVQVEVGALGGISALRVDFKSPYLRFPMEIERAQIGVELPETGFEAAAFRFFDWHSWQHIAGEITWHGEREVALGGKAVSLVTGFTYRPGALPEGVANLGLRIAEGVEGTIRVRCAETLVRTGFEPGYWLLEPSAEGYRLIAIREDELMALIVSLSEIGSGNPEVYRQAVDRLWTWVDFHLGGQDPERALLKLLGYVRDWGPLGLAPLYQGLKEILERLGVRQTERILFEYYAEHWGVRNNPGARLLAVRTLDALGTGAARTALRELLGYARVRVLDARELYLLSAAAQGPAPSGVLPSRLPPPP